MPCFGHGMVQTLFSYAGLKQRNLTNEKLKMIKKRRKDGLGTPQSLPPIWKEKGRNKRLGASTRGEVWESVRDRSKLAIHEPTGAVEEEYEQDEEESEKEDNEIDPSQLETQSQVVVEQVGPSQQLTQCKGTCKVKVKGSHLPHIDDMIPDLDRGEIWGATSYYPGHLFGYKDSWARTIYQTYDHKKVVRVCRNQATSHWYLSKECEEVQTLVKDSGLYPLVENYVKPGIMTVNCFLHALTNKLFGWDYKTSVESFYVSKTSRTKTIKLTLLKKKFEDTAQRKEKDGWDPAQIYYTTAVYLLFILGTRVFPDTIGNRVSANYLHYLDPLEEVFSYSWGTVVMTHLMTKMRMASKEVTNQFVGNFTLLHVWAYEHFPTLFKGKSFLKIIPIDDPEELIAKRYQFNIHPKLGNNRRLIDMRLDLDAMTTKDVVFDPYREARENRQYLRFYNVEFYNGPLFHPKGYVMADPRSVMRQLGYKQLPRFMTASIERYLLDLTEPMSSSTRLRVENDPIPEPTHWRDREPRRLVDATNWELVNNGDEFDPAYIDNYLEWSHPFVVRPDDVEVPPQKNPPVPTPTGHHLRWPNFIRPLDCYGVVFAS
ncbi:uncharacterized protein LOC113351687 [Papaver somniferum]|uniref:uncharacterized protein LOC113351687 n=1 Tax=Papaver somniferum TaxID=3469 RepID=UPI000E6F4A19|nr:uncharacterized protein LOC113351687 [Papaver somniferum]